MQLIESRVSTFKSALQISSCLDFLYAGVCFLLKFVAGGILQVNLGFIWYCFFSQFLWQIVEDEFDENATIPVIFEDKDESDEEESEDAMETDQGSEDGEALDDEAFDGVSDFEGIDDMSDWWDNYGCFGLILLEACRMICQPSKEKPKQWVSRTVTLFLTGKYIPYSLYWRANRKIPQIWFLTRRK